MKSILTVAFITLLISGCAQTWSGVKHDSGVIWDKTKQTTTDVVQGTKEAIHQATE